MLGHPSPYKKLWWVLAMTHLNGASEEFQGQLAKAQAGLVVDCGIREVICACIIFEVGRMSL